MAKEATKPSTVESLAKALPKAARKGKVFTADELAKAAGVSAPTVRRHISALESQGLIQCIRQGRPGQGGAGQFKRI